KGDLANCLSALTRQQGVEQTKIEIIVPCDDRVPDLPARQQQFPHVQFLPFTGRRTYAELRAQGVNQAGGSIIALTEDQCTPVPDWCAGILQAHQQPPAAIGGPVEKTGPDTALNWAFYLADYVRYANPRPAGPADHLTDCNVTYKRAALEAIAPVWRTEFHEPEVHAALQAAGHTLWFAPELTVHQHRRMTLRQAIRDRYAFGRLFGSGRAAGQPLSRRLAFAAAGLALPLLLTGRVAGHVFRRRRYRAAFLRALPALALVSTVWAWGELAGYLTGQAEESLSPANAVNERSL
ncbi:MAG: glycosyltransferase, partial [Chloroflexi bacterium]